MAGTTDAAPDDHLPDAIRWAVDHGAKVVSLSLAGARAASGGTDECPAPEQAAVFHALARGAVVLAAGGNRGAGDDAVEEPGVCVGVLSVGAVDRAGKVAAFSSRHRYLTLAAPGVDVPSLSREPGAAYAGDGTSQATALASASAALVWSAHPHLTGRQVVARILASLDHRRATPDPALGYGTLDTYRAVTARIAADAPNPVFRAAEPYLTRGRIPAAQHLAAPVPGPVSQRRHDGLAAASVAVLVLCSVLVVGRSRRRRSRRSARRALPGHAVERADHPAQ
jgi:subtilisin family serine protease